MLPNPHCRISNTHRWVLISEFPSVSPSSQEWLDFWQTEWLWQRCWRIRRCVNSRHTSSSSTKYFWISWPVLCSSCHTRWSWNRKVSVKSWSRKRPGELESACSSSEMVSFTWCSTRPFRISESSPSRDTWKLSIRSYTAIISEGYLKLCSLFHWNRMIFNINAFHTNSA